MAIWYQRSTPSDFGPERPPLCIPFLIFFSYIYTLPSFESYLVSINCSLLFIYLPHSFGHAHGHLSLTVDTTTTARDYRMRKDDDATQSLTILWVIVVSFHRWWSFIGCELDIQTRIFIQTRSSFICVRSWWWPWMWSSSMTNWGSERK